MLPEELHRSLVSSDDTSDLQEDPVDNSALGVGLVRDHAEKRGKLGLPLQLVNGMDGLMYQLAQLVDSSISRWNNESPPRNGR